MKCLIVLFAVAAVALANPQWGQWNGAPAAPAAPVQDTPEVAAAKAAHFAAVAQAQSNPAIGTTNQGYSQDQGQWNQGHNNWNAAPVQQGHYQGPLALPPGYAANGAPLPVQDTPEVASLKAHQLSLLSSAGGNVPAPTWNPTPTNSWNSAPVNSWNSAPANNWNSAPATNWNTAPATNWNTAPVQAGPVQDTPEVAAAKAAHFAAVSQAQTGHAGHRWRRSAVLPVLQYGRSYTSFPGSTAPLAAPVVHPLGYAAHYPTVYSGHWW